MNFNYFIPHHTLNHFLLLLFGFVPIQRDALGRYRKWIGQITAWKVTFSCIWSRTANGKF